jgi:hypothetical protein
MLLQWKQLSFLAYYKMITEQCKGPKVQLQMCAQENNLCSEKANSSLIKQFGAVATILTCI